MPELIQSPSGWSYMSDQENGDNVDCWFCGDPLNDDADTIVTDDFGHAMHDYCSHKV